MRTRSQGFYHGHSWPVNLLADSEFRPIRCCQPTRRPAMTIRPAAPVVLAPLLFLMACAPAGGGRDPQSAPTPPRGAERQQARPLSADETAAPPREAARPLPREANP